MSALGAVRGPPITIDPPVPSATAPGTLIFLHGYNDTASRFNANPPNKLSIAYHIHQSPRLKHLTIIIPEALPCMYPGLENAWYRIATPLPGPGNPDSVYEEVEFGHVGRNEDDMTVSMDYLEELIRTEVANGVPASRIVLMGYSQGAAILTLFILTRRLAADIGTIISYSGIPSAPMQSIARMQKENGLVGRWSKGTKLFMLHGQLDVFMPLPIFHKLRRRLEGFRDHGQGITSLEWELLEGMPHPISEPLWPIVRQILEERVALVEMKPSFKL